MKQECAASCGSCDAAPPAEPACDDVHDGTQCAAWAAAGECEANEGFMKRNCAASCGTCGWGDGVCAARRNSTRAMSPGGVNAMFERAASNAALRPKVWSRDPWVVTFDDFVSEEEGRAFIAANEGGFNRSLAGDMVSPVRTSTQAWCNQPACLDDPLVRGVHERVVGVTGVPIDNAEYFQVVHYEPGQFYRSHHDQNTAPDSLSGVRLFTFFIYLLSPEAGGETRFPALNLTIPPTRGTALLWANVQDDDPSQSDGRTTHEAVPPERGEKYAANLWLHQYDFRTPSRYGCDMDRRVPA